MTSRAKSYKPSRSEIVIAVIGLFGVLTTAFLSNWDKLFPKQNTVHAEYSGYRPTGNFETELRYFFEVSGLRVVMETQEQQLLQNTRNNLIAQNPKDAEEINRLIEDVSKDAPKTEDIIKLFVPIYQKHLTIAEIQELNKFYSTDVMQRMAQKLPLIAQDGAQIQAKLLTDMQQRFRDRANRELTKQE